MKKEQRNFLVMVMLLVIVCLCGQILNLYHVSEHYHEFVDTRNCFGVDRFFDTLSNIGFFLVGIIFFYKIYNANEFDINLWLVAIGSILVCFGSGYYHLLPMDSRLLWDRLPISLVFCGILCYSVHANNLIKESWISKVNIGYLVFSICSVLIWYVGALYGKNWLGPYVFIQFGGLILLVYIALTGKNKKFNKSIYAVLFMYVLAKICEHFDVLIYQITNEFVSGHTLKHIFAAVALYYWFPKNMLRKEHE